MVCSGRNGYSGLPFFLSLRRFFSLHLELSLEDSLDVLSPLARIFHTHSPCLRGSVVGSLLFRVPMRDLLHEPLYYFFHPPPRGVLAERIETGGLVVALPPFLFPTVSEGCRDSRQCRVIGVMFHLHLFFSN